MGQLLKEVDKIPWNLLDLEQKYYGPNIDNFRDVYVCILKISSAINTPKQCANSVIFKKYEKIKKNEISW